MVLKKMIIVAFFFLITACAQLPEKDHLVEWDFDHNVQFEQQLIADKKYHIEVRTNGKTKFSKLATFLLRKSYRLCRSYGFTIEVLDGIEEYNDRVAFPHLLMGSLAANVQCPSQ